MALQRAGLSLQIAGWRPQMVGLGLQSLYPIYEDSPVRAERMARRAEWGAAEL